MSLTPEQMGLVNPVQPAGAIVQETALPDDVMEAPAVAYGESHAPDPTSELPASWLGGGTSAAGTAPAPVTTPGQATNPQQAVWDSDQNPYKKEADALRRQVPDNASQVRAVLQNLPALIQQTTQFYMSQGYDQAHAQTLAEADGRVLQAEATVYLDRQATAPAARQLVAEDIAKRFSIPGITLSPADLSNERTVAGMEARARTLVETRRTQGVQSRQAARTDVVENSSGVTGGSQIASSGMNSFETIRSGLRSSGRRQASR